MSPHKTTSSAINIAYPKYFYITNDNNFIYSP